MTYTFTVQPFASRKEYWSELENDWTIMISIYLVLCFSDIVPNPKLRYAIGWFLAGIQGFNIAVTITRVIIDVIKGLIHKCKESKYKKWKKKRDEEDQIMLDKSNALAIANKNSMSLWNLPVNDGSTPV